MTKTHYLGQENRIHHTPIRLAKIQNTDNTRCWRGCGQTGTLLEGTQNATATLEELPRKDSGSLQNYDPVIMHLGIYPEELNLYPYKIHMDVYSRFTQLPTLESNQDILQ